MTPQQRQRELAEIVIVFYHQHGFRSAAALRLRVRRVCGFRLFRQPWQVNFKCRAFARLARYEDLAAALFDDADRPSTVPAPFPLPFSFVVKNGSKMRDFDLLGSMPVPVSLTVSRMYEPGARPRQRSVSAGAVTFAVWILSLASTAASRLAR